MSFLIKTIYILELSRLHYLAFLFIDKGTFQALQLILFNEVLIKKGFIRKRFTIPIVQYLGIRKAVHDKK